MIVSSENKDNGDKLATVPLVAHEYEMYRARKAVRFWRGIAFLAISLVFTLLAFWFVGFVG